MENRIQAFNCFTRSSGRTVALLCAMMSLRCVPQDPRLSAQEEKGEESEAPVELILTPANSSVDVAVRKQFQVQGTYRDGATQDLSHLVTWSVIDIAPRSGVATIDASGVATGDRRGTATVRASYRGLTAEATLRVGLAPGPCSVDKWCAWHLLPEGERLNAIWGKDAKNVWAVGDRGTILKWNGYVWENQPSETRENLFGVWGSDINNVWAVGLNGTRLIWDGRYWQTRTSGFTTSDISSLWGSAANNVWAIG